MKKIIIAIALGFALASPASGEEPRRDRADRAERSERVDRAPNPYSNAEQAKRRRIRDSIREAQREDRGRYRFKSSQRRDPE